MSLFITWSPSSSCPPSRTECSRARGWTLWPPAGRTPPPSRTCPSSPGSGTAPGPAQNTLSICISKYILLSPGTPLAADRSRQMWRRRADPGWLRSREDQTPFELRLSSPDLNMSHFLPLPLGLWLLLYINGHMKKIFYIDMLYADY